MINVSKSNALLVYEVGDQTVGTILPVANGRFLVKKNGKYLHFDSEDRAEAAIQRHAEKITGQKQKFNYPNPYRYDRQCNMVWDNK